MRVTIKTLERQVKELNEVHNKPTSATRKENGKIRWNIGAFTLSGAYGKYALHQIINASAAVHDYTGYLPKRELSTLIQGMIISANLKNKQI